MFERNIFESYDIREIPKHISYNSILFLDIDQVIQRTKKHLGGDPWFTKLIDIAAHVIPDKAESFGIVLAIYNAVQELVETELVEKSIVKIIKMLKHIGIPIFAITARNPGLIDATLRQLNAIDIDFTTSEINHIIPLQYENKTYTFYKNIIFCDGHDKGSGLLAFKHHFNINLKELVMVDDKLDNLIKAKESVTPEGIHFTGIHYRHEDERVALLNMEEAHRDLSRIRHQLPPKVQEYIHRLHILPKKHKRKLNECNDRGEITMFSRRKKHRRHKELVDELDKLSIKSLSKS